MKSSFMKAQFPTGDKSRAASVFQNDVSRFRIAVKIKLGRDGDVTFALSITAHDVKILEIRCKLAVETHCHCNVSQRTQSNQSNLSGIRLDDTDEGVDCMLLLDVLQVRFVVVIRVPKAIVTVEWISIVHRFN